MRDGVLMSYRCNDTSRIRLRACYETRRVYCSSRRSAKVFSSGNANSINRKRFSAVDTWARGWHAHPRAEDAPVAAQRERAARARDPEAAIFFLLRIPRPKGQIASILVSTALKPQLPKSRQLNGARHDETHPPLRRSSAAKDMAFESKAKERNLVMRAVRGRISNAGFYSRLRNTGRSFASPGYQAGSETSQIGARVTLITRVQLHCLEERVPLHTLEIRFELAGTRSIPHDMPFRHLINERKQSNGPAELPGA